MRCLALALLVSPLLSCRKVPIYDIGARFALADTSWFAEEETLFVFYEIHAEQGISEESVVEVSYVTDDGEVPFTPLTDLPSVHTHVAADCGPQTLCGSASVPVPLEPRSVAVRMRYHRDGELALTTETAYNVVEPGPAHTQRSLVVYGVFDETNSQVQWRSRNQLPTIRNERASELGLRRTFTVRGQRHGTTSLASENNPYSYGVSCPVTFPATGALPLTTNERASFEPEPLPEEVYGSSVVCAEATVEDATGTFTAGTFARKNPEVRPAFPLLRTPIEEATQLRFFLGPCDRTISALHEDMLRQRLQLGATPKTCTDDWQQPGFVEELVDLFRSAVEGARPAGDDMVLVIAIEQDEVGLSALVEDALDQVVPSERLRSSPRLAGAFLLDSDTYTISSDDLARSTLWCPSTGSGASAACAVAPDPEVVLGPFSFASLPILPTRDDYLEFIDTYSEEQAGEVQEITFLAPELATVSDHVDLGDFAVATFLNGEQINADPDDAFSYCLGEEPVPFVFRSEILQSEYIEQILAYGCEDLSIPEDLCATALYGLSPLEWLPDWHNAFGESSYDLGLLWDFPFLVRMEYSMVQAGAVSAFGFSVPFGIAAPGESYYGTPLWMQEEFPLAEELTQCSRFCDHPTFDSASVYHVTDPFRSTYAHNCYLPVYPKPGDSGFPLDP